MSSDMAISNAERKRKRNDNKLGRILGLTASSVSVLTDGEKTRWELRVDTVWSFVQLLKAAPYWTVVLQILAFHLVSYPGEMSKTAEDLGMSSWATFCSGLLHMDVPVLVGWRWLHSSVLGAPHFSPGVEVSFVSQISNFFYH